MGPIVQTTTNRLTMKQWTIVAAAVTVTFPAGPISRQRPRSEWRADAMCRMPWDILRQRTEASQTSSRASGGRAQRWSHHRPSLRPPLPGVGCIYHQADPSLRPCFRSHAGPRSPGTSGKKTRNCSIQLIEGWAGSDTATRSPSTEFEQPTEPPQARREEGLVG